ncbi:MAG: DciA family protein [Candidatus Gastranaerophilales bacterium]|nr:DciA family protein [Candidatus Gastranaerophilales bacterium]
MKEDIFSIKDILKTSQNYKNSNFAQLVEYWDAITGNRYKGKTFVEDISTKYNKTTLKITASSSAVIQELSFFKKQLIEKVQAKFAIKIDNLVFSTAQAPKINSNKYKPSKLQEVYNIKPTDEELGGVVLDEEEIAKIKQSLEKQTAFDETKKQKVFDFIIKDLKTQKWMKAKGFPVCEKCGRVMSIQEFNEKKICPVCLKELNLS